MQTTITARHCEISDALRERAPHGRRAPGQRWPIARSSRPSCSTPTGTQADGGAPAARCRAASVLVARGEADDHRTALDRAEEKLRRQLEKASRPRRGARATPSREIG